MSGKDKEILKMDLYGLLGIDSTATTKQIKKAYRKKALECHPDKNPDNPEAAELFHKLSKALELLTDVAAKAAYDKICAAKKQEEERNRKLDDKRKKMKFDLEARERQAEAQKQSESQVTRGREEEIVRLREEGARLLEEEQRRCREQIQKERETHPQQTEDYSQRYSGVQRCTESNATPRLKLKWKCKKDDETNGGYSKDVLLKLFQKYGDVLNVVVSSKKKGIALVEFSTVRAAERAVKYERGLTENLLKVSWLEGQPEVIAPASQPGQFMSSQDSLKNERDYESVVMMKMRQAAERQRLIDQMQREDEEDATGS